MIKSKKLVFAILALLVIYMYGVISTRLRLFPAPEVISGMRQVRAVLFSDELESGSWFKARTPAANGFTSKQQEAVSKISSLPYLKGYSEAPAIDRVTVYDSGSAYNGYNLLVSGHGSEAVLVDMTGEVRHKWVKNFDEVWPVSPNEVGDARYQTFWNRVHLFDNGDLLAIFRDFGLIKLDKESRLLWKYEGRCHHDLAVTEAGDIYVLVRETVEPPDMQVESWRTNKPIWDDQIVVLDKNGAEKSRVSILECFQNSDYSPILEHLKVSGNILHTNALKIIDAAAASKQPLFNERDILISCREIHTIAVLNLASRSVVWAMTGMWKYQHEPTLLDNGNILLFDNRGYFGKSKVMEIDPMTRKIEWVYRGKPPRAFYSQTAGTCRRLPNGNTLITESNRGRVFEVSSDGTVVWEYYNPHRAGEKDELIAALYDVIRVENSRIRWLDL